MWTLPMKRTVVIALPKTETATGTTTANPLVVVVGVAAAGVAAAGTETESADIAPLAIDRPRYEPLFSFLLYVLSAPSHEFVSTGA